MPKHVGFTFAILGILVIFVLLVIYGEDPLMDSLVSTGPDLTLDMWHESFLNWSYVGLAIATLAALFWLWWGKLSNLNNWRKADNKRIVWFVFLVVSALAALPGVFLTPAVQEGGRLAGAFYFTNNLALFYLSTLCFSASSFKYVPPLAMLVRHW